MRKYNFSLFIIQSLLILILSVLSGFTFNSLSDSGISLLYRGIDDLKSGEIITAEQAGRLLQKGDVIFLDVRTAAEFNEGHIPGAINIPPNGPIEVQMWPVENLDKDRLIVVYCISIKCPTAIKYAAFLDQMGFSKIAIFEGGWHDWQQGGYPVE